ncbi:tripartite motif-containing protein 5-like [Oncorhynchus clarkii lewisi]|uniref:tripartite motif-containing protein 5-like n=1 Tax=Oncorhynchus clarkii lewisi TaxID=490388 RepID=UPI0039B9C92E
MGTLNTHIRTARPERRHRANCTLPAPRRHSMQRRRRIPWSETAYRRPNTLSRHNMPWLDAHSRMALAGGWPIAHQAMSAYWRHQEQSTHAEPWLPPGFSCEEQFQCSICLDVFTEPVSIPCGHNYCKACIRGYWDIIDLIQERLLKVKEIKQTVELSRIDTKREIADSVEVFPALVRSIERSQAELIMEIEKKLKAAEKQAEIIIEELRREITELQMRSTELEQLSDI